MIAAVAAYFMVLCLCDVPRAAAQCSVGQWCWQSGWSVEYFVATSSATAMSNATSICSGLGSELLKPSLSASSLGSSLGTSVTSWTSLTSADLNVTWLQVVTPFLATTQWDGCWESQSCCLVMIGGSLTGVNCTMGTARNVVCQRPGVPTSWLGLNQFASEYEYGYFTRKASFTEAQDTCRAFGGDLAVLPQSPSNVLQQLASIVAAPFWVGYCVGTSTPGSWTGASVAFNSAIPFSTLNMCSSVSSVVAGTWTTIAANPSTRQPFLCQRLRTVPISRCTTSASNVIEYFAGRGYTRTSAIQTCNNGGGEVTKFASPIATGLSTCFGASANILLSVYGFGIWLDSSTAPVPSYFNAVASSACTYYNNSGPSALGYNCSYPLGIVCEYQGGPSLRLPSTIVVGSRCSVQLSAATSIPTNTPISYITPFSTSTLTFPIHSTTSSSTIDMQAGSSAPSTQTISFRCNDTSALACLQGNVTTQVTFSGVEARLSWSRSGSTLSSQITDSYAPDTMTGYIGVPLVLGNLSLPTSTANITVGFTVQQGTSSTMCYVRPERAGLSSATPNVQVTAHCDGGSNATTFGVIMTTSSVSPSDCSIVDYVNVRVVSVAMVLNKYVMDNKQPLTTTYTLLNSAPYVDVSLSALPSGFILPTWVCLKPVSVNDTSLSIASFGGVACLSSASSTSNMRLTFNMGSTTANLVVVQLAVSGNAATSYDTSRSLLVVQIRLSLIPIVFVSPIYEYALGYVFQNTPFLIQATIANVLPAGRNLSVECVMTNVETTPRYYYYQFSGASSNTSTTTATIPNSDGSEDKLFTPTRLLGEAAAFFLLNTSTQRFRVLAPMSLDVSPYIPKLLFVGQSFMMQFSVPTVNPLRGDNFTFALACAVPTLCTSFGLTIMPSSVQFLGTNPVSRTFTITGNYIVSNVQLQWAISTLPFRYVQPTNFVVSVRNRVTATVAISPARSYYFDTVPYTVRVVADAAAPQQFAYFNLSSSSLTVTQVANITTTSVVSSLIVLIAALPSTITSVASTVVITGPDQQAFTTASSSIAFSPYVPRIQVTFMQTPSYLVVGDTVAKTIDIVLSRALVASSNLTIRFTSSGQHMITPALLVWRLGDNTTRSITIAPCTAASCAMTGATVTAIAVAVEEDGSDTLEVIRELVVLRVNGSMTRTNRTGTFSLPTIARSTVSFQTSVPTPLRLNETLSFPVTVGALPFAGTLNISIVATNLYMVPTVVQFTASSPSLSVMVSFVGLQSSASEVINIVLAGEGALFYSSPAAMCSYIDGTLFIATTPANLDASGSLLLLTSQQPAVFYVTIPTPASQNCLPTPPPDLPRQLPAGGRLVRISLSAVYEGYASAAVSVFPTEFEWTSSTPAANLQRNFTVISTGVFVEPSVTIVGTASGNGSSYRGFQTTLYIVQPSPVTISFPTGLVFPLEVATINVTVGRRVVITTTQLIATLQIVRTNCSNVSTISQVGQFTFNSAVSAFLTLMPLESLLTQRCSVDVVVGFSGEAMLEYLLPVNESTRSTIWFVPRRKVLYTVPTYTFDRSYFEFNITLEAPPDPGTTIRFQSTASLGASVVWSSDSPTTQSLSLAPPYLLPGLNTVPLTLIGSTTAEQNRYETAPSIVFSTLTKLTLLLVGAPIRSYQVIGPLNQQTVGFRLSRPPLNESDVIATVSVTTVIPDLLQFFPTQFRWSWNDTSLDRNLSISGNALGSAQSVQFVFTSNFSAELGIPDTSASILPLSVTVVEQYRLTSSILPSVMYVDEPNQELLNVTLIVPAFASVSVPFTVACRTDPVVALCYPANVTFNVTVRGSQFAAFLVRGVQPGIGRVILTPTFSPELSSVLQPFEPMEVRPLVRFDIAANGQTVIGNSTVQLTSDDSHTFTLTMSSYAVDVTAMVEIIELDDAQVIQQRSYLVLDSSTILSADVAVVIAPTNFTFSSSSTSLLLRSFSISCFAKTSIRFQIQVRWYTASRPQVFAPPYSFYVVVAADWTVALLNFPTLGIYNSSRNTLTFAVALVNRLGATATSEDIASSPGGLVELVMVPDARCTNLVTFDAKRDLAWTAALNASPIIQANATYNESSGARNTCSITFRKESPLQSIFETVEHPTNTTLRYNMLTQSIVVYPAPHLSGILTGNVLTNQQITSQTSMWTVRVANGLFRTLPSLRFSPMRPMGHSITDDDKSRYDVIVSTDATLDVEPLGFMMDQIQAATRFASTSNGSHVNVTLSPVIGLVLIAARTFRMEFILNAFAPAAFPATDPVAIEVLVTKYVPDIITPKLQKAVGIVSALVFPIAGFAAPSVTMLLFQQNLFLLAFNCPDDSWQEYVFPFGTIQSLNDSSLDMWMSIAAAVAAVIACLSAIHLAVVAIMFAASRDRHFSKLTQQRYKDVANRFTVIAAVLHFPTVPCVIVLGFGLAAVWYSSVTLINSTAAGFRVIALVIICIFVGVFPFLVHGVVSRSYSLEFIEYKAFNAWLGPCGFWWHADNPTYLPRYWVLVQETRRHTRWYTLAQYVGFCLVSIVMGVQPTTNSGCTIRMAVVASLFGVGLVSLCLLRPFRIALINYMYIAAFLLQFVACVVLTRASVDSIRSTSLLSTALYLSVAHIGVVSLLGLLSIFCRCFAKPVAKAIAVLEFRQGQLRKKQLVHDEIEYADNVPAMPTMYQEDDADDTFMNDDAEEVLHPGHPLYDRDTVPVPQVGHFRHTARGYRSGAEVAFSPLRKQELYRRSQLHQHMIDETLDLGDADLHNTGTHGETHEEHHSVPAPDDRSSAAEHLGLELEDFRLQRRSQPQQTSIQASEHITTPSRLQVVEL